MFIYCGVKLNMRCIKCFAFIKQIKDERRVLLRCIIKTEIFLYFYDPGFFNLKDWNWEKLISAADLNNLLPWQFFKPLTFSQVAWNFKTKIKIKKKLRLNFFITSSKLHEIIQNYLTCDQISIFLAFLVGFNLNIHFLMSTKLVNDVI